MKVLILVSSDRRPAATLKPADKKLPPSIRKEVKSTVALERKFLAGFLIEVQTLKVWFDLFALSGKLRA